MSLVNPAVKCDRCGNPVNSEEGARLHSLRYSIRKASPRSMLDLCDLCFGELLIWIEKGRT